jgi:hypothetical protein
MRINIKIFALIVLIFLVCVNFASAMPAGDFKDSVKEKITVSDSEEFINKELHLEESDIEDEPLISQSSAGPQPLGITTEVDALGPYGNISTPYYEGDTVNFDSVIINGSAMDYYFRWDVDNDGLYEVDNFGVTPGITHLTYEFTDNYGGQAMVEAWDGLSMVTLYEKGDIWDGANSTRYLSGGYYNAQGIKFRVHHDIIVDQIGYYREEYPSTIYNLRIWDSIGNILFQVVDVSIPMNSWGWFPVVPITLFAGNDYIISCGAAQYQTGRENPGITADGVIEPLEWVYYSGSAWGYPGISVGTSPLPLVDIRYNYSYQLPDTIEDYADVYVENVDPIANAGSDITASVGERIDFSGSFTDPGTDDTHTILWTFGDGGKAIDDLFPNHTYLSTGNYTVTLRVIDDDGGIGVNTLTVYVNDTRTIEEMIIDLIIEVEHLNLPFGLENSYLSKLKGALKSYEKGNYKAAINKLWAFIYHVGAQRNKALSEEEADSLIEAAQNIIYTIPY